jgi:hypothetical protein
MKMQIEQRNAMLTLSSCSIYVAKLPLFKKILQIFPFYINLTIFQVFPIKMDKQDFEDMKRIREGIALLKKRLDVVVKAHEKFLKQSKQTSQEIDGPSNSEFKFKTPLLPLVSSSSISTQVHGSNVSLSSISSVDLDAYDKEKSDDDDDVFYSNDLKYSDISDSECSEVRSLIF